MEHAEVGTKKWSKKSGEILHKFHLEISAYRVLDVLLPGCPADEDSQLTVLQTTRATSESFMLLLAMLPDFSQAGWKVMG